MFQTEVSNGRINKRFPYLQPLWKYVWNKFDFMIPELRLQHMRQSSVEASKDFPKIRHHAWLTDWRTQEVSDWTTWMDWLSDRLIDYVHANHVLPDSWRNLFRKWKAVRILMASFVDAQLVLKTKHSPAPPISMLRAVCIFEVAKFLPGQSWTANPIPTKSTLRSGCGGRKHQQSNTVHIEFYLRNKFRQQ